jgi:hypothetical protein
MDASDAVPVSGAALMSAWFPAGLADSWATAATKTSIIIETNNTAYRMICDPFCRAAPEFTVPDALHHTRSF